jgi:hypothetical protein
MELPSITACLRASLLAALPFTVLGCEQLIGAHFGRKTLKSAPSAPSAPSASPAPSASCAIRPGGGVVAPGDASDEPDLVFVGRRFIAGTETDGGMLEGLAFGFPAAQRGTCSFRSDAWPQILTPTGPTGLVNAVAGAAHALQELAPFSVDRSLQDGIDKGKGATLFRLAGFNRTENDPEVILDVFPVTMVEPGSTEPRGPPTWTGSDTWYPLPQSLSREGSEFSPRVSLKASVRDGALEMSRQDGPGWLAFVEVHAKVRLDLDGWHLDGGFTGAAPMPALFVIAEQVPMHAACGDSLYYQGTDGHSGYKRAFCERRDVDTDGDGLCDALSLGQAFFASPAQLGCRPSDDPPPCPPSTSVRGDVCDPASALVPAVP